jgi:hypothetical protein
MKKVIIIFLTSIVLISCGKEKDSNPQEYVFGLKFNSYSLDLSYLNLNSLETTNNRLLINTGILFRGTFDGLNNYYASVGDTIFEIDITKNTISKKFKSSDSLLYIFKDYDTNEIIGVSVLNDTINISKLSLVAGTQSLIKTSLTSHTENFMTDVNYNSIDKTLIIKIGNDVNIIDIMNGARISKFEMQNVIHGLSYSNSEKLLYFLEFSNNELKFKKCDLSGNEKYSKPIGEDIVAFYADNLVLTDTGEYIFVAINKDQKNYLYRISFDNVSKTEIVNYESIFGFSYIKK